MSDKLSSLLKDHGFSFVKLPRPIQLLDLYSRNTKGHLIRVGSINDLFVQKETSLPANIIDQPVPTEIGGLVDKKVEMKLSMSLLKGFLPNSVGIESAFNNANKISFSFINAKLDSTVLIQLDKFINNADVSENIKTYKDKLMNNEMYVITEVLKSKSFSVEALGANDISVDLDGPEIEKIVKANTNIKRSSGNNAKITYEGDQDLAIGIKAAQIHNDKSWKFWKEMNFSLRSGSIESIRGESATAPEIQFLKDKYIQID